MKRIFAVIMALILILSTTSQAYVVTVYGQNCTYTMTSPENRKITLSDKKGNVRWWEVKDTSNNIIGAIDGKFVTPSSDVEVTPMLTGNQIVVQQTANGTIKYNGNVVNTVETTENQSYTLAITPNSGYEIATVKVDNVELEESEITANGMDYAFNNVTANHVITATFTEQQVAEIGTPNAPVLGYELAPVNWENDSWVITTEDNWDYNYNSVATATHSTVAGNGNGKWANAQTDDGSLYVWIPRYTYKITSGNHQDVDSWNADEGTNKTGKIEIKFSNGTTDDNSDGYLTHPAFTFEDNELKGIWVAKYEASRNDATATSEGSGTTVSSKPGVKSWTNINIDFALDCTLDDGKLLMGNEEWGAVAYLTNAIGRIPYINNSSEHITGNAGGSQGAAESSDMVSTYAWNTANGVKASTTHNVYGIYDMSGGASEYVSAFYVNGDSTYLADDTNCDYGNLLYVLYDAEADCDIETYMEIDNNGFAYSENKKGDAIYETSCVGVIDLENMSEEDIIKGWDGDFSLAPSFEFPFFLRGGQFNDNSSAGIFNFDSANGGYDDTTKVVGFRGVIKADLWLQ